MNGTCQMVHVIFIGGARTPFIFKFPFVSRSHSFFAELSDATISYFEHFPCAARPKALGHFNRMPSTQLALGQAAALPEPHLHGLATVGRTTEVGTNIPERNKKGHITFGINEIRKVNISFHCFLKNILMT